MGQLEASMQRPTPADSSLDGSQRDRSDSGLRAQKSASLYFQDSFECPPEALNNTGDGNAPTRSRPTVRLSTAPLVMHESTRKHSANKGGRDSESDDDYAQCMSLGRQSPRGRHDRYDDPYRAVPPAPPPNIHQATGIPKYHGVQQSGHRDDWLEVVDQAGEAYHYTEAQKKFTHITLLDPPIKKYLKTYSDAANTSYRQMCALLKRRFGAEREHEYSRNSFQLNKQELNETAEDFLVRLMRAHKSGYPNADAETREREVLNTLLHGLKDTHLGNTLDMEYQKPMYLIRPPRMMTIRSYIQGLESSKELRRLKEEMTGAPRQVSQPL